MYRYEVLERAYMLGVKLVVAQSSMDNQRIAIHLLNPDLSEIDDALDQAERDGFEVIVLHTKLTWPSKNDNSYHEILNTDTGEILKMSMVDILSKVNKNKPKDWSPYTIDSKWDKALSFFTNFRLLK